MIHSSRAIFSFGLFWGVTFLMGEMRSEEKPNFVVIVGNNLGHGEISPYGAKRQHTPNLQRMAKEGMTLTSFYAASSVSTASRAALMTGCYPQRVGLARGSDHGVLFPGDRHGLNPDEITIAETLKSVGYATGCFGKWHLGDQPKFLPTAQGFNRYYGIPYSSHMWPQSKRWPFPDLPIVDGMKVVGVIKDSKAQLQLAEQVTRSAVDFIRSQKYRSFFVYLAHTGLDNSATIETQLEQIDESVGAVVDALREEGLAEKTLVLFTADNGPAITDQANPFRGGKGSGYEGGHRVPMIAWWPGRVPPGGSSDAVTTAMDLHPTIAHMAQASMRTDRKIDGKNIESILLGKSGALSPYDRFFYQEKGKLAAVRSADWKLFTDGRLFNLKTDRAETTDVADDNPDVILVLEHMLREFQSDIVANARPVGVEKDARTLVARPGVTGEAGFVPTLLIGE